MKWLLSFFFVGLLLLAGCEKVDESKRPKLAIEEIKNNAKEVVSVMSEEARRERDDFIIKAKVELDALSIQIEAFAKLAEKESGEVKEKMEEKLNNLKKKRSDIGQNINEIQSETSEKWREFRIGISDAIDDLKQSVDNAKSRDV